MSFPLLIGVTGRAGVGKDTLARYLQAILNRLGWPHEFTRDSAFEASSL
jgi:pantothenate kinase